MPTGVYLRTKELSIETRVRLSKSKTGILNPMFGKSHSPELKAKRSKALMGNKNASGFHHTKEWKNRMSIIQKGIKHASPTIATRAKLSECNIGKTLSEETKRKIGIASREHWQNNDIRAKTIKGIRKLWMNPLFKETQLKKMSLALNVKPNKPEQILLALLNKISPNEWAFVGDGQLIIGGKKPDFWDGDNKLVELFGDYWHGKRARCYEETEEGRIKLFKRYGYKTLVIWEGELKTPHSVLSKIQEYIRV